MGASSSKAKTLQTVPEKKVPNIDEQLKQIVDNTQLKSSLKSVSEFYNVVAMKEVEDYKVEKDVNVSLNLTNVKWENDSTGNCTIDIASLLDSQHIVELLSPVIQPESKTVDQLDSDSLLRLEGMVRTNTENENESNKDIRDIILQNRRDDLKAVHYKLAEQCYLLNETLFNRIVVLYDSLNKYKYYLFHYMAPRAQYKIRKCTFTETTFETIRLRWEIDMVEDIDKILEREKCAIPLPDDESFITKFQEVTDSDIEEYVKEHLEKVSNRKFSDTIHHHNFRVKILTGLCIHHLVMRTLDFLDKNLATHNMPKLSKPFEPYTNESVEKLKEKMILTKRSQYRWMRIHNAENLPDNTEKFSKEQTVVSELSKALLDASVFNLKDSNEVYLDTPVRFSSADINGVLVPSGIWEPASAICNLPEAESTPPVKRVQKYRETVLNTMQMYRYIQENIQLYSPVGERIPTPDFCQKISSDNSGNGGTMEICKRQLTDVVTDARVVILAPFMIAAYQDYRTIQKMKEIILNFSIWILEKVENSICEKCFTQPSKDICEGRIQKYKDMYEKYQDIMKNISTDKEFTVLGHKWKIASGTDSLVVKDEETPLFQLHNATERGKQYYLLTTAYESPEITNMVETGEFTKLLIQAKVDDTEFKTFELMPAKFDMDEFIAEEQVKRSGEQINREDFEGYLTEAKCYAEIQNILSIEPNLKGVKASICKGSIELEDYQKLNRGLMMIKNIYSSEMRTQQFEQLVIGSDVNMIPRFYDSLRCFMTFINDPHNRFLAACHVRTVEVCDADGGGYTTDATDYYAASESSGVDDLEEETSPAVIQTIPVQQVVADVGEKVEESAGRKVEESAGEEVEISAGEEVQAGTVQEVQATGEEVQETRVKSDYNEPGAAYTSRSEAISIAKRAIQFLI